MKTFNGMIYNTFQEAACARKLIGTDENTYNNILTNMPHQIRVLFSNLMIYNKPNNALLLFN